MTLELLAVLVLGLMCGSELCTTGLEPVVWWSRSRFSSSWWAPVERRSGLSPAPGAAILKVREFGACTRLASHYHPLR
jgi:hypothetical protein